MTKISSVELEKIIDGLVTDRESIVRNNPIGTPDEIMLWMLLSSLILYLNLDEIETPCFSGQPDGATYRQAIEFILRGRKTEEFDAGPLLDKLSG